MSDDKKVIFLDIDGVLNHAACMSRGINIDPERVLMLNDIVQATKAYIVISSSWRGTNGHAVPFIAHTLSMAGLSSSHWPNTGKWIPEGKIASYCDIIIGHTDTDYEFEADNKRGDEVDRWLGNHPEVCDYIILDDDKDFHDHHRRKFINTSFECGLTPSDVEQAIKILGRINHDPERTRL